MSFQAEAYRVLIGSPSDLSEERVAATDVIHEWNDDFADAEKVVLLPVKWETHAMPQTGVRPQEAINRQLVSDCDILIGIFWTRIGTRTGVAEGGTVEEINLFVGARKPALLYFSNRPIDLKKVDFRQYEQLSTFKTSMERKALMGDFSSLDELRQKLRRDLLRQVRELRETKSSAKALMPREDSKRGFEHSQTVEVNGPAVQTDDDEESDIDPKKTPSKEELQEIGETRRIAPLVAVLRNVGNAWKEQIVPSKGGSFRYWAEMEDGSRRVVCGLNVGGGRFNAAAGILDVWVCYDPAMKLGRYTTKDGLIREFAGFKKSKYSKSRFWIALSEISEAERLYNIFSVWTKN